MPHIILTQNEFVTVKSGCFRPTGGATEHHVTVELNKTTADAATQYRTLEETVQRLLVSPELKGAVLVWKRFFASDAVNQAPYLTASAGEAVSVVQQPPLNGTKASLLLYFVEGAQLTADTDGTTVMKRPHYTHLFHTRLHEPAGDVTHQTREVFDRYSRSLSRKGCTLERNCIRTWIFVQNVDVQYSGMVVSRKEYFEREGLTRETHYIASTGIEGRYTRPEVLMLMDAYAVADVAPEQIGYLQAPTHLNPTCEYGVTFERGTTVDYGDRRHIFISGTASINNRGEIVHPLNIEKQTERTFENIQALLAEADADMRDAAHLIVYLRDTADYDTVDRYITRRYPDIPRVTVLAPVCRPGWLIEIECMAVKQAENKQFAAF